MKHIIYSQSDANHRPRSLRISKCKVLKALFAAIVLCVCFVSASGQVAVRDTVYVYETVVVYDTVVIHDTIRINKAMGVPAMKPADNSSSFSAPPAATFPENSIKLHENKKQKNVKLMKLNTVNYLGAIILTAQSMAGLSAQELTPTDDLKEFPMQMSVVYPMTTQGDQTINYRYKFSFNLFAGRVGAVTGVEYGSFLNRVERDITGVQVSGLFNLAQSASGIQFGGLGNASKTVKGIQVSGLGNVTGSVTGVQFGGIGNISENAKGIQLGGLVNISKIVKGFQFGGITNLCEQNKGLQIAGIANVTGNSRGFQFAGVTNISSEVSGASFGGLFNRTGTLRGFQFGLVNVTDTIEKGASFAIVNIVKKGFYNEWSLTFADYMNVGLSYKMGTQKFYTIYSAGANFIEDKLWVVGFGFGNRTTLGKRIDFQPEIVSYSYYPEDFKNVQMTWVTHIKFGFIYKLNDRLGIQFAPSIYHLNCDLVNGQEVYKVSPIKSFYSEERDNSFNSIGIGLSVGLVLK